MTSFEILCFRFELIEQHLFEFSQLAAKNANGVAHMLNRVFLKDHIAICAVLEAKPYAWNNTGKIPRLHVTQNQLNQLKILMVSYTIGWCF